MLDIGSFAEKTKRWWKQYFAMLVKRYYNFIRFRVGFVWQFMFPVLFVALGLIIAATIPNLYGDDPKRLLTLQHSAPEDKIKLFWGDFSESDLPFNIEVSRLDCFRYCVPSNELIVFHFRIFRLMILEAQASKI